MVFEIERNPNPIRREYALKILTQARQWVTLNEAVEKRARVLNVAGVKPVDALHLASAEAAQADYFCTCDDQLLRHARGTTDLRVRVVSPLELVGGIEK